MASIFRSFATVLLSAAALAGASAFSGEFAVQPVRLDLGPSVRSGAIAVRNEGKEKLSFQIQAVAWSQDQSGKDQYQDTQDLIYFPRLLSVEPGEEGVIRIGARNTVLQVEKTYRVFIEELPGNLQQAEKGTAQVSVLMRFGAPVFMSPVKPQDSIVIGPILLSKGALTFSAHNTGNRHQVLGGIDVKGADATGSQVYATTLADRYLLAGATKSFSTNIAAEQCGRIKSIVIDVKTDKAGASRTIDVTPAMCP